MTSEKRPIVYLSRRESFSAAHRLCAPGLTIEQNEELFGPCAREFGHGHNYVLDVTLRGSVDPVTGILVNLTNVKDAVRNLIIEHVDHRHLNCDSLLCTGVNPTTENLAVLFWNALSARFGSLLFELRLRETEKNWVVYRGECSVEDASSNGAGTNIAAPMSID